MEITSIFVIRLIPSYILVVTSNFFVNLEFKVRNVYKANHFFSGIIWGLLLPPNTKLLYTKDYDCHGYASNVDKK